MRFLLQSASHILLVSEVTDMGRLSKKKHIKHQLGQKVSSIDWDNIQADDLKIIAKLISESYNNNPEILKEYGLKVLHSAKNWKTGFEAIAVKAGKDVLMLFPGTKNLQDCVNDALFGAISWVPQCEVDVENFFDNVIKEVQLQPNSKVICLGHSLGAILSDYAVAMQHAKHFQFCDDIRSITIENPGSKALLNSFDVDGDKYQVFNANISNGINSTLNQFVEPKIVKLPLSNSSSSWSMLETLNGMFNSHSIDSFMSDIRILPSSDKDKLSATQSLASAALEDARAVGSKILDYASSILDYASSSYGYFSNPFKISQTDPNTTDPNTTDSNTADPNTTDSNTADPNTTDSNTADSNTADSNTADPNTTDSNTRDTGNLEQVVSCAGNILDVCGQG